MDHACFNVFPQFCAANERCILKRNPFGSCKKSARNRNHECCCGRSVLINGKPQLSSSVRRAFEPQITDRRLAVFHTSAIPPDRPGARYIDADLFADDVGLPSEVPLPHVLADHRHRIAAGDLIFLGPESAA
jgi:hypothetical protein